MASLTELKDTVTQLPRGGFLVQTPSGYVQIGSPVETIKDTLLLPEGVPQFFVLPRDFFNWDKGINVADLEFPVYYNFFLKQRKTIIVCEEEQALRMQKALQEAVFGPMNLDIAADFFHPEDCFPMEKELQYFKNFQLADLLSFGIFKHGLFATHQITVKVTEDEDFEIWHEQNLLARIPGRIEYKVMYNFGDRLPEPYLPPLFGMACLGRSHGFDHLENSSGFLMWVHHNGIMIDPPVNSTEMLEASNVNPKYIDSIILTHCHADHDAGTFQKILEEGRVTIYTTRTIMESFLRKYSALTGVASDELIRLFDFYPVQIGKPVFIHGARLDFYYSLHSIPTIAFDVLFQDKKLAFSSDTFNTPEIHDKLKELGILGQKRYEQLRSFSWDADIIYHEAGIPPIHTPLAYLGGLDPDVAGKIRIYHISEKDFKAGAKPELTYSRFGVENSEHYPIASPAFEQTYQLLGILKHLDFSRDFPLSKAQEFISILEERKYKKGEYIIERGRTGENFYIIYSGNVAVQSADQEYKKVYGAYEYFGEVALITGQKRTADVVAQTDVVVYTIQKDKFLNFITNTDFEKTLLRLAKNRTDETWRVLAGSSFLKRLTSYQITWLESMLSPQRRDGAGDLQRKGEPYVNFYLIRAGQVQVMRADKQIKVLGPGDFVGAMGKIAAGEVSMFTFYHSGPLELFLIPAEEVRVFLSKNPGLAMKLVYEY